MKFWRMIEDNVIPDNHTIVAVLWATSKLGDVKTAADIIGYMKRFNIPMNDHVYNGLIKTYGGACLIKDVAPTHIDQYLEDIWKLVDQMEEKGIDMNIHILNSITLAYCNANKT